MQERHLPWLWAAYKRGSFEGLPPDLPAERFKVLMLARIEELIRSGGDAYVAVAGEVPVGVATVAIQDAPGLAKQAHPHAIWFPEATARAKLEAALRLILDLKKDHLLLIAAKQPDWRFFHHLCKYGAIRHVGTLRGYFEDGAPAGLWQGVK